MESGLERQRVLLERVRTSAAAFMAPIEAGFGEEYGISDEDAERGALAMMLHLGVITEDDKRIVERHWKAKDLLAQRRLDKAYRARRAAMTPEQRQIEGDLAKSMQLSMEIMSAHVLKACEPSEISKFMAAANSETQAVVQTRPGPRFKRAIIIPDLPEAP